MPYDFGNIMLVPFPFTNQSASKKRPAVIVSNGRYDRSKPDVVVMPITSQLHPNPVFVTPEQRLIIRLLGALAAADKEALRKAMNDTLA